jgi:hypothetical protein
LELFKINVLESVKGGMDGRLWEMPKGKKRWLLRNGLVTGLILLMATPCVARPPLTDEMGPCACIFMIIVAVILLLQIIPAAILFLCISGVILVFLYRWHKNKNTITKSSPDQEG